MYMRGPYTVAGAQLIQMEVHNCSERGFSLTTVLLPIGTCEPR